MSFLLIALCILAGVVVGAIAILWWLMSCWTLY